MKADPKYLRVGNIVDYFNEASDRWLNGHELSNNDMICLLDGRADQADSIPLTVKWLVKFGFERGDNKKKSDSFYGIAVGGSMLFINPDNGVVWIERNKNVFNNPALIEYVHQLQNLYFALTGTELELTQ